MFGGSSGNLIMGLHVQSKQQMDAAERRAAELCLGAGLTNDYRGEVMATTIREEVKMKNDKQTAELAERMAIAFHNSQFNNGNYGLPWEKVSKESKLRYMQGMVAVIEATGQARDAEVAELVGALEKRLYSISAESFDNGQRVLAKHKQDG